MLKNPTSRRRSSREQIELNLVPILDTMVCLIGFMLFTTSFLSIVSIESPFPMASSAQNREKIKEKPLQLTLSMHEKDAEIWSPFERIKAVMVPNLAPGQPDIAKIHEALIGIKQKFLTENQIVLVPTKGMNYDTLIQLMDGMRGFDPKTDPLLTAKNPQTGVDEPVKALFPNVIFGNLLGDG